MMVRTTRSALPVCGRTTRGELLPDLMGLAQPHEGMFGSAPELLAVIRVSVLDGVRTLLHHRLREARCRYPALVRQDLGIELMREVVDPRKLLITGKRMPLNYEP